MMPRPSESNMDGGYGPPYGRGRPQGNYAPQAYNPETDMMFQRFAMQAHSQGMPQMSGGGGGGHMSHMDAPPMMAAQGQMPYHHRYDMSMQPGPNMGGIDPSQARMQMNQQMYMPQPRMSNLPHGIVFDEQNRPIVAATGQPFVPSDQEEEFVLNLLMARRQRGRLPGEQAALAPQQQQQQQLAEEMMRLRQARGQMRNMTQMPTMQMPFYPDDERIDLPTRLMDARTQEMRDFSARGLKRADPYKYGGGYGMDVAEQSFKKKRTHKKKPADMPRRPLSAYNLFFSEERERILKEIDEKEGNADDRQEEKEEASVKSDDDKLKPKALLRPIIPSQKKRRPHRKTHGKISFQELAKMVGERWKNLDDDRRKYYQDLAQEDMKRQKVAMEEYWAKQNAGDDDKEGNDKHVEVKQEEAQDTKSI